MNEKSALRPFGMRDKLGYSLGDMGCNFTFQIVSTFFLIFATQSIGIKAEHFSIIILVGKLFDAINDVVIGNLVDTKHIGKGSKYMPWIKIGGVLLVVTTIMMFIPLDFLGDRYTLKAVYCCVAYCLWSIAYTMVNVPYGSLHSAITDVPTERTSLSTFRSIGAALPAVIVMVLNMVVFDKKNVEVDGVVQEVSTLKPNTLLIATILMSICALICLFGTTKLVSERVHRESTGEQKIGLASFFGAFKSYFTNRPLVGVSIATIASVALFNSTMSLSVMVFQYFFGDGSKATIATMASYVPMVAVMAVVGKLTAKFGKKNVISVATLISSIGGLILLLLPIEPNNTGMLMYIGGLMLVNVGNCTFQVIVWAIIADCIEISFRKTGKSEEGSLYALYSFFRKLSQGIGQAVVTSGLAVIGFVEGENAIQPEGFGDRTKSLYIICLLVGSIVAFLSLTFIYNITKEDELAFVQNNKTE